MKIMYRTHHDRIDLIDMTPEEANALKRIIEGASLEEKRVFFHVFDELAKLKFLWNDKQKPALASSVGKTGKP